MPPKKRKIEDRTPVNYSDIMNNSFTIGEVNKFGGFKKFYVKYNGEQPYLKTTRLRCAWDWDSQYAKQLYLTMSFDDYLDEGSKVERCYNAFKMLDDKIKKHIEVNCKELLGISRSRLNGKKDKWYNSILYKKDQYPPSIKVKAAKDPKTGKLKCNVYEYPDMENPIDNPSKIAMRGRIVVASMELTGVWFVDKGDGKGYYTPSFRLAQLVILPPQKDKKVVAKKKNPFFTSKSTKSKTKGKPLKTIAPEENPFLDDSDDEVKVKPQKKTPKKIPKKKVSSKNINTKKGKKTVPKKKVVAKKGKKTVPGKKVVAKKGKTTVPSKKIVPKKGKTVVTKKVPGKKVVPKKGKKGKKVGKKVKKVVNAVTPFSDSD